MSPTTARQVIRIRVKGGKTAEFEDRPARLLLLVPNLQTKALEPVIEWGKPVDDYLAREVGGDR
ncbi:MAG TPA: hypothetical protein VKF17_12015 [Isosphaeraceae bacterium]|nr:hypothetical protein [Isosphaeraceae bacterium]